MAVDRVRLFAHSAAPCQTLRAFLFELPGGGVKAYGTYVGDFHGKRVHSTNISGIDYAVAGMPVSVLVRLFG